MVFYSLLYWIICLKVKFWSAHEQRFWKPACSFPSTLSMSDVMLSRILSWLGVLFLSSCYSLLDLQWHLMAFSLSPIFSAVSAVYLRCLAILETLFVVSSTLGDWIFISKVGSVTSMSASVRGSSLYDICFLSSFSSSFDIISPV